MLCTTPSSQFNPSQSIRHSRITEYDCVQACAKSIVHAHPGTHHLVLYYGMSPQRFLFQQLLLGAGSHSISDRKEGKNPAVLACYRDGRSTSKITAAARSQPVMQLSAIHAAFSY
jgi:ankyrin repeat protein